MSNCCRRVSQRACAWALHKQTWYHWRTSVRASSKCFSRLNGSALSGMTWPPWRSCSAHQPWHAVWSCSIALTLAIDTCFCTSAWSLSKQQTPQAHRQLLLLHAAIGSGQLVVSKGVGSRWRGRTLPRRFSVPRVSFILTIEATKTLS